MRFMCDCGNVIRDQTDHLPWKGHFFADQDSDDFWDAIENAAIKSGPTPADKRSAMLKLVGYLANRKGIAYQCGNCGRLYIYEIGNNNTSREVHIFNPESSETSKEIFRTRPSPADPAELPGSS